MNGEVEAAANLEVEAVNAMIALVTEHGYSEADLEQLVHDAVQNAG